jgi:hypothetical protein
VAAGRGGAHEVDRARRAARGAVAGARMGHTRRRKAAKEKQRRSELPKREGWRAESAEKPRRKSTKRKSETASVGRAGERGKKKCAMFFLGREAHDDCARFPHSLRTLRAFARVKMRFRLKTDPLT